MANKMKKEELLQSYLFILPAAIILLVFFLFPIGYAFVLSFLKLKKLNFKIDYERIINKYLELSSNFEFKNKLIIFSKRLRFFSWLYEKDFIKKRVGSDVKYFFELIEILNKMGKNAK